ncbi:hypothetical protein [Marinobacter sp.]|uniref:hypothetical protein n=1 Tax=Marinobacter sp. TaxID=50741 RepID=UPI003850416C
MDVSIASVSERDIDFLLLEEFIASPAFGLWFVGQALTQTGYQGQVVDARRSVTDTTGESDIEVTFEDAEGRRTLFLLENKVGAGFQPQQAARYRLRGEGYVSRGICNECCSVIVAPSRYFGLSSGNKGFDHKVTYEMILNWFRSAEGLGNRRDYKVALLQAAIEKGTLGYQPEEDSAISSFWREYWLCSCEHAPELEMQEPGGKPAGSTFVSFHPPEMPRGINLVHKLTRGYVDLQVHGAAVRLNSLRAQLQPVLAERMTVTRASKSGAVRLSVPRLDTSRPVDSQTAEILAGLQAAQQLFRWYCMNEQAFADF